MEAASASSWTAPSANPGETFPSRNPANGQTLAQVTQATQGDVDRAVAAARAAQPGWAALGGHGRARVLYAIARLLQKQSRLFSVLETLDNGKPIRESRDIDIPLAIRHFYHHAGYAELQETELAGRAPLGVCGQVIPWNFPLLMLAWKVAPALAMGNTVVLKPAEYTSLSALLFADLCRQAGVPPGVVNVVTGDGRVGEMVVAARSRRWPSPARPPWAAHPRGHGRHGKALTLELGGKSPYIVFDDADLDSAVEGLVDAIWFNQGQVCCAGLPAPRAGGRGRRPSTASSAAGMDRLRIGDPLDKAIDVGPSLTRCSSPTITRPAGRPTPRASATSPPARSRPWLLLSPHLITGLSPSGALMQEEIFGPVLVSTTFRTPSEAVELANNTRYGLAATVWTENVNLALDVAPKLVAGVVWVNGTNLFDAAAPFGGVRESGFGREGGWEGLSAYTRPAREPGQPLTPVEPFRGEGAPLDPIDRTAKLYIGGKQARPDGGYSRPVWGPKGDLLGHASLANRKDVRNAVEAANAARSWGRTTGHARAQILYFLAENLSARAEEFAKRIDGLAGQGGREEVEASLRTLFRWAAWADKVDGRAAGAPFRGVALAMREPVGTLGVLCDDRSPLLGLVATMAPAIALGNRTVLGRLRALPPRRRRLLPGPRDLGRAGRRGQHPHGLRTGSSRRCSPRISTSTRSGASPPSPSPPSSRPVGGQPQADLGRDARAGLEPPGRPPFIDAATEVKTVWIPYGEG
jgi:aldehyde dehydrogenase (NAD+)